MEPAGTAPRRLGLGRWLCGAGAALMALAPFLGSGEAIMANYIPVLDGAPFLAGCRIRAGAAVLVLHGLLTAPKIGFALDGAGALHFGLNASVVAGAVALLAFAWSWAVLPQTLAGRAYYEILFWAAATPAVHLDAADAGGLAVAGRPAARRRSARVRRAGPVRAGAGERVRHALRLPAHDIASVEHRNLHTWGMRLGGGLSRRSALAVVLACALAPLARRHAAAARALLVVDAAVRPGGLIGVFIAGSNVRIPAHYHGCIVGVTLALMGLVYHLLPASGLPRPRGPLARCSPRSTAPGS